MPEINGFDPTSHAVLLEIKADQVKATNVMDRLDRTLAASNQLHQDHANWFRGYIERTMPIKSHYMILVGSLSILATFAAAMKIIDRIQDGTTLNPASSAVAADK